MISARDNSNAFLMDQVRAKERMRTLTATTMMANTHDEPVLDTLRRVDWWALVGLLMIAVSAVLTGWIVTAVIHFVWRHWL